MDRVLSSIVLGLLNRAQIRPLLSLLHVVEFSWVFTEKECCDMSNYATALRAVLEACGWSMMLREDKMVSEPVSVEGISESEMTLGQVSVMRSRFLLDRVMKGGLVNWTLVLLLVLLRTKQLVSVAMARRDVWERCRTDMENANEWEMEREF